jgi:hypothetical protein
MNYFLLAALLLIIAIPPDAQNEKIDQFISKIVF